MDGGISFILHFNFSPRLLLSILCIHYFFSCLVRTNALDSYFQYLILRLIDLFLLAFSFALILG